MRFKQTNVQKSMTKSELDTIISLAADTQGVSVSEITTVLRGRSPSGIDDARMVVAAVLMNRAHYSQTDAAVAIGYTNGSVVSRWKTDEARWKAAETAADNIWATYLRMTARPATPTQADLSDIDGIIRELETEREEAERSYQEKIAEATRKAQEEINEFVNARLELIAAQGSLESKINRALASVLLKAGMSYPSRGVQPDIARLLAAVGSLKFSLYLGSSGDKLVLYPADGDIVDVTLAGITPRIYDALHAARRLNQTDD